MSNRTMLEINHDYCPHTLQECAAFGKAIGTYLATGDPSHLPQGVTFFHMRHHSEPCPLGDLPRGGKPSKPQKDGGA